MEPLHEVAPELEELKDLVRKGLLTKVQVDIFISKATTKYEDIILLNGISGPTALSHCLVRTAMARYWYPGLTCGANSYLSPADEIRFREIVQQLSDSANCVTTTTAVGLAHAIHVERVRRATKLLIAVGSDRLASSLQKHEFPSRPWLNSLCQGIEIRICRGEELELARRLYCDREAITQWFLHYSEMFNRPIELLFNMDETQVTAKKKLKVLCTPDRRPLQTGLPVLPHMTGAITINAAGHRIRPLLILPKKRSLRSIEGFDGLVYLAGSTSGWMTKNLYTFYAMTFVSELSFLRLRLKPNLREEPALLFVDGHSSRWNFKANLIFWLFNVDVLSFPGHTSHLLQMFDVGIASPLKDEFKRQITGTRVSFLEDGIGQVVEQATSVSWKPGLNELRSVMIQSFVTAYEKVVTTKNCRNAFASTGVAPYCPERVLHSAFAMDPPTERVFGARKAKANSCWLTSEEALRQMFYDENQRELTEKDLRLNFADLDREMRSVNIDAGIPLSLTPEIIWKTNEDRIYKLLDVTLC